MIIHQDGDIKKDITKSIKTRWLKWSAFGVLCNQSQDTSEVGRIFYKTAITPTMLYGLVSWAIRNNISRKLIARMRMLRWMRDNTLKDRIINNYTHGKLEVTPIEDSTRENCLR